ncbi:MAG: glycosyltransferase family 9 protein [Bacteroidetes bacterium]|nr:glycosyltransferase family 9 protein [Bacteroidota bacterium]
MKILFEIPKAILISRTDSIGDVMLTLPMCAALKEKFSNVKIYFLASNYTIPVIECMKVIDQVIDYNELINKSIKEQVGVFKSLEIDTIIHVFPNKKIASLAKKAKVKYRIGTSHRAFHWLTCNYNLNFTRKNSALHEAQLNFELLKPLGFAIPTLNDLNQWISAFKTPLVNGSTDLEKLKRKKIILHPMSQGSAVEWPLHQYSQVADYLIHKGVEVYVTGTEKEGQKFRKAFNWSDQLKDTSGQFTLTELIAFINGADGLIACSTGPLHIAGALGTPCVGLFSPRIPIHPGRWRPLGEKSSVLTGRESCACKSKEACDCLLQISVDQVTNLLDNLLKD